MEKWKPLNMELRSWVISHVLRLEQTSSSLIRTMLRMFNENSKTLGNQSSALSFKSKIDLLLDLEEINKTEYNHLLKLMEIRNQFAHNPNAISFESLDEINPDINKYLFRFIPADTEENLTREEILKIVFLDLFTKVVGRLLVIEIEYSKGIEKEIRKHINDHLVENLDSIWKAALERNKENKMPTPRFLLLNSPERDIERFYLDFRIVMGEFAQGELAKYEGEELKKLFKRKKTTDEMLKELKDDKEDKTKLSDI
nr:hypothetical protein [uncultured Flavobacterium sp.]